MKILERARRKIPRFAMEDPAKAQLERLGVIDVGSNSVRLVVFDGMARSPAYFYNEKVLCGLGAGLAETGRLSPEGWRRALATLHRFKALADRMGLSGMIVVATAAVRDAIDGPDFCDQVERETGLQMHVAGGSEEARLAAKGVLLGWPDAEGLVCDMGGASMELAHVSGGEIGDSATSPLGPLKIVDMLDAEKRDKYIRKNIKALRKKVDGAATRLYLVGGSWRAIARLDMERVGYPLKVLHGYEPPIHQLVESLKWICEQEPSAMSSSTGISMARLSLLPQATLVLAELIRRIDPQRITISAFGLREGLLYRQMPLDMRALDPLIESCRHMESAYARAPGFGTALYDWLLPIYAAHPPEERRLLLAACHLHDINWRSHPDYRGDLCFDAVVRANIAGFDHAERIFLGLAILNRYRSATAEDIAPYVLLLSPERIEQAAVMGRAMRLGAMLSGSSTGVLDNTELRLESDRIVLVLRGVGREFAGEAVEKRLSSLASRLKLKAELVLE